MINNDTKFLIIGLGLIGGSYAKGLSKAGYTVYGISKKTEEIDYAVKNNIIKKGSAFVDENLVKSADIIIFALYPNVFKNWIKENGHLIKKGTLITDVTGVKKCIVSEIQDCLGEDVEFISAHPMAGKEVYGIENSDEKIFYAANYIVVPTEKNTKEGIETCKQIGQILKFAKISELSPDKHDEMIAFLSQLAHCIAICLMTSNTQPHLEKYTGDSFRDLTRIANINENMWSELFLLNKDKLLYMMELFENDFIKLKSYISNDNIDAIKDMMRLSTKRRKLFNKNNEE